MICAQINACKKASKHPKISLKDTAGGGSIFKLSNPKRKVFHTIDFEKCVYKNKHNETKCDFGLLHADSMFYIELKGSDVDRGIEQLLSTIYQTERCFKELKKKARLVITRFPSPEITLNTPSCKRLKRLVSNDLIIKQDVHTETI
jgi:hypothetical protein